MPQHSQLPHWENQSTLGKLNTLHQMVLDLYRYQLQPAYDAIIADLKALTPADEKEAADINKIIDLINKHPNILNQNCEVGHITASALIIDQEQQRVLLHFHKSLSRWLQVGGHVDYELCPAEAAKREAEEESGLRDLAFFPHADNPTLIDVDLHTIPQKKTYPEHLHLDLRYLLTTQQPDQLQPEDGESAQLMWVAVDEVEQWSGKVDASLLRFMQKARRMVKA